MGGTDKTNQPAWQRRLIKTGVVAIVLVVFIRLVPLVPFTPWCGIFGWTEKQPQSLGTTVLAPRFHSAFTELLTSFGVAHFSVDSTVYLTVWDWAFDPDSWISNAQSKPLRWWARVPNSSDYPLGSRLQYREEFRHLQGPRSSWFDADNCALRRQFMIEGRYPDLQDSN